jgi:hypothetical protein
MKNPRCAQLRDVGLVDLVEAAESLTGVVAVVRWPVACYRLDIYVFRFHVDGNLRVIRFLGHERRDAKDQESQGCESDG